MIHVMVGIPASGKSTVVEQMKKKFDNMDGVDYVLICPDDIRAEMGDEYNPEAEGKVWAIAKGRLKGAVDLGIDHVVFDATMVKRRDRKMFFKEHLTESGNDIKVVAWVVNVPYETSLIQNKKRQSEGGRFVPEDVIKRMSTDFTMPTTDEGFDKVNVLTPES
jgi:predicted kinase